MLARRSTAATGRLARPRFVAGLFGPQTNRYFLTAMRRTPTPLGKASVAAALGTAQGIGGAVVAAAAHRLLHTPPATTPVAAAVAIDAPKSLTPALRKLNQQLVRKLIARLRAQASQVPPPPLEVATALSPSGTVAANGVAQVKAQGLVGMKDTAMRAWRVSLELGQARLAIDLYDVFRQTEGVERLRAHEGARLIRWLGDVWAPPRHEGTGASRLRRHRGYSSASASAPWGGREGAGRVGDDDGALPQETLRAAFLVARDVGDFVPADVDRRHSNGRSSRHLGDDSSTRRPRTAMDLDHTAAVAPAELLDALVGACADCGDLDKALALHANAKSRGRPLVGGAPLSRLIGALCDAGRADEAMELYMVYEGAGLQLNNSSLVHLLRACQQLGSADGSGQPGIGRPGSELAEALMSRLGARRLPGEGCATDVAQIRAYAAHGKLSEALHVYREATRRALPHAALARAGMPEQLQLLNAALYACARSADAAAALGVYRECSTAHPALPDAVSVNTLLAACVARPDAEARRAGFEALREAGALGAADVRGVVTLMAACERTCDGLLAVEVHRWATGGASGAATDRRGAKAGMRTPALLSDPRVPAASRGLLVDSLFCALCPPDESLAAADAAAEAHGESDLHASVLRQPHEALEYARHAYSLARQHELPYDATLALRAIVTLTSAAGHFREASEILAAAEAHGRLLAPSELMQQRVIEHMSTPASAAPLPEDVRGSPQVGRAPGLVQPATSVGGQEQQMQMQMQMQMQQQQQMQQMQQQQQQMQQQQQQQEQQQQRRRQQQQQMHAMSLFEAFGHQREDDRWWWAVRTRADSSMLPVARLALSSLDDSTLNSTPASNLFASGPASALASRAHRRRGHRRGGGSAGGRCRGAEGRTEGEEALLSRLALPHTRPHTPRNRNPAAETHARHQPDQLDHGRCNQSKRLKYRREREVDATYSTWCAGSEPVQLRCM